jgi:hypothetical protein
LEIELPDGTILEAPDDADPSKVAKAYLAKSRGATSRGGRPGSFESMMEVERGKAAALPRQLGLTARAGIEGIAALPLAVMEGGAGIANLATGGNYSPTRETQAGLSRFLPAPETTTEKAANFGAMMVAGSRTPGMPSAPAGQGTSPQVSRVLEAGRQHHVPVYYDDVGGAFAKRLGVAAEPLGAIGTGSGRAIQADAAKRAATDFVADRAPSVSDDVPVLIQKSLGDRLGKFRAAAGKLYDRTDQLLSGSVVQTPGYKAAIQRQISELEKIGTAGDPATIATLRRFIDAPAGDFAHMRAIRSALSDEIAGYYTGSSAIGKQGVASLQAAKNALEADMAAHAKAVGGKGFDAWKAADGFYRQNIVPFKEAGFRDLVKTAEPEKVWRYLVQSKGLESRAVRMYNSLTRDGKAAVRYGFVKDALDDATDAKGTFSPAKFAKYLEDHEKPIGVFFRGRDKVEIDGFRNLMRHVERAGQFAENPPTGQRVIPYLVGGAATISPSAAPAAAAIATVGLSIRALYQTEAGRNLMLRAASLKPGSPEMQALAIQISRYAAATGGAANVAGSRASDDAPERPIPAQ